MLLLDPSVQVSHSLCPTYLNKDEWALALSLYAALRNEIADFDSCKTMVSMSDPLVDSDFLRGSCFEISTGHKPKPRSLKSSSALARTALEQPICRGARLTSGQLSNLGKAKI